MCRSSGVCGGRYWELSAGRKLFRNALGREDGGFEDETMVLGESLYFTQWRAG